MGDRTRSWNGMQRCPSSSSRSRIRSSGEVTSTLAKQRKRRSTYRHLRVIQVEGASLARVALLTTPHSPLLSSYQRLKASKRRHLPPASQLLRSNSPPTNPIRMSKRSRKSFKETRVLIIRGSSRRTQRTCLTQLLPSCQAQSRVEAATESTRHRST